MSTTSILFLVPSPQLHVLWRQFSLQKESLWARSLALAALVVLLVALGGLLVLLHVSLIRIMLRFKSGYRNGHISAGESAANRMEALITELHEQGYGLEDLEADNEDEDGEDNDFNVTHL
ncbi:hypothetical protein DFH08DRAFT_966114 [Mycena albidolilacea]|uniref:Uncharacterized protein n=1 Tax=Mycena albidolilacea TaxID=1033008 RepID=A0AAD6ZPD5_9AGAR|nr:hypothetical protein DFH08DRAFT_966114 [Mycena albidolilacea]